MAAFDDWIDRHLRRLRFGQFLERAAEWLAGALFVFGAAVLVVKLLVPAGWPHVLWLALAALPVGLFAWRLAQCDRFTRAESAALLDRKLEAGGLLMTLAESRDARWSDNLPSAPAAWSESLPKLRPVRFAKLLALPMLFAVAACFVPLRQAQTGSPPLSPVREQATRQLEEMLAELKEADVLEPDEQEQFEKEIEKLAEESKKSPLTHENWETLDELRTRLTNRLERAARTVAKGRDAAAVLANSAAEGKELSVERREQLEKDVAEALQKLAKSQAEKPGPPSKVPPELAKTLERLAQSGQFQLPKDPAEQKKMLERLQKFLGNESDKLGRMQAEFGQEGRRGRTAQEGGFARQPGESPESRAGQGGVDEGGGKTELTRDPDSKPEGTTFRDVVLPPGFLDQTRQEVTGITAKEPEVDPAAAAPRNPQRNIEAASGGETWRRQLRPRHRDVVRKYFESKE